MTKMTLNQQSEGLYNVLEQIDNNPRALFTGNDLAGTGVDSYTIDKAVREGYLIEDRTGHYQYTAKGIELLNQMRLKIAIERFDKASRFSSWVVILLTILIAILTIVLLFRS